MAIEYQYLAYSASEMYSALLRDDLAQAANIGCQTLARLAEDDAFFQAYAALFNERYADQVAFHEITGSIDHFRFFLENEEKLAQEAGMDPALASELTALARELRVTIRESEVQPETLLRTVVQLRDYTCNLASSFWHGEQQEQMRGTFRKITLAVGGAALIAIDAGSLGASLGLTAAGSAVSGAIGSTLIAPALEGLVRAEVEPA